MTIGKTNKLKQGFTLVELIVVIVVIVIITAITFVSYNEVGKRAVSTQLRSDINDLTDQIKIYQARSSDGSFPANIDGMKISSGATPTYVVDNSGTPKTFSLTLTKGDQTYSSNMGTVAAGPSPVFYIDAGNSTSYPGSGTAVNDLSGYDKPASLKNGVGYSSANGGSWVFDGVDDVIDVGYGNSFFPMTSFSMELWFKSDGLTPVTGTDPGLLGITYSTRLKVRQDRLYYEVEDNAGVGGMATPSDYDFFNSSWHQVVVTTSALKKEIYVDGSLSISKNEVWDGTLKYTSEKAYIGYDMNNTMYYFRGNIASFRIYNGVLSASDVNKQFEDSRGLYGI